MVMTGKTFILLINDILEAYNNKKIPEVKGSVQRVL